MTAMMTMDNNAVVWSLGFVESWIEKASDLANKDLTVANAQAALEHLSIIEAAFHEMRRKNDSFRNMIQNLKAGIEAASLL